MTALRQTQKTAGAGKDAWALGPRAQQRERETEQRPWNRLAGLRRPRRATHSEGKAPRNREQTRAHMCSQQTLHNSPKVAAQLSIHRWQDKPAARWSYHPDTRGRTLDTRCSVRADRPGHTVGLRERETSRTGTLSGDCWGCRVSFRGVGRSWCWIQVMAAHGECTKCRSCVH